jgi:hypothetical protein
MPMPGGERPVKPARPRALRAARINGNRDWLIYIECRYEGVILYPSQQRFTLAQLETPAATNPLWQMLWQNILRKQALVAPGEPPYRPQIRFLVRQDGMRAFHSADSLLETLRIPRAWQALNWNDDAAAIMEEGR